MNNNLTTTNKTRAAAYTKLGHERGQARDALGAFNLAQKALSFDPSNIYAKRLRTSARRTMDDTSRRIAAFHAARAV